MALRKILSLLDVAFTGIGIKANALHNSGFQMLEALGRQKMTMAAVSSLQ
jgi:hypothetical protein